MKYNYNWVIKIILLCFYPDFAKVVLVIEYHWTFLLLLKLKIELMYAKCKKVSYATLNIKFVPALTTSHHGSIIAALEVVRVFVSVRISHFPLVY